MLDFDYSVHFAQIVAATPFAIELPSDWDQFFHERGVAKIPCPDLSHAQRLNVRTKALIYFEVPLPAIPRTMDSVGVYTRDFSKDSVGLASPIQLYPEEVVRLVLPTLWLKLRVTRVLRHTSTCYEIGTMLLQRCEPDPSAFIPSALISSGLAGIDTSWQAQVGQPTA